MGCLLLAERVAHAEHWLEAIHQDLGTHSCRQSRLCRAGLRGYEKLGQKTLTAWKCQMLMEIGKKPALAILPGPGLHAAVIRQPHALR